MRNRLIILAIAFIAIFGTIGRSRDACAFDADSVFTPWKASVSIEASFAHFGIHLGESGWVQAWMKPPRLPIANPGIGMKG